ncbi:MAG: LuxR C-terminal-related transcriptional regulator [Prevotellaceae bacterium]|jgi:DNA-binding NarL/FixJ family response regulator|nr:LuxR C-terminal-related transcriptional regulator [Prevotellaceae bacterium]
MNLHLKIIIAESSVIIRTGIVAILQQLNINHAGILEIEDFEQLRSLLGRQKCDMLIINPLMSGVFSLQQMKKEAINNDMKYIALQNSLLDRSVLKNYDEIISLYDSVEQIKEKVNNLITLTKSAINKASLTSREKEIIVCVIKGMTNKQIADELCLSIHTIISHRSNITTKLQIHSTAGLTIFAIVNKLVTLDEIKKYQ